MSTPIIPPMTHELGRQWEQPPVAAILLDETHALMTLDTFNRLMEYSATKPSGAYEGKMWKRHDGIYDRAFIAAGGQPSWLLCWYGLSMIGPGFVSNHHRLILLVDRAVPA